MRVYIESTPKAIRSWLSLDGVPWEHRIKVTGAKPIPMHYRPRTFLARHTRLPGTSPQGFSLASEPDLDRSGICS